MCAHPRKTKIPNYLVFQKMEKRETGSPFPFDQNTKNKKSNLPSLFRKIINPNPNPRDQKSKCMIPSKDNPMGHHGLKRKVQLRRNFLEISYYFIFGNYMENSVNTLTLLHYTWRNQPQRENEKREKKTERVRRRRQPAKRC